MKLSEDLPELVLVVWDDAWSDSEAVHEDSHYYEQSFPKYEVGFLKPTKNGRVVVARTYTPGLGEAHPTFADCVSIPRPIVKHILKLSAGAVSK